MTTDYFEKILKSSATFLARWRGATAELFELTSSHKALRILLRSDARSGNLLIACLDPLSIKAPVRWQNANLKISRVMLPEGDDDGFLVSDEVAGAQVLCGSIEIKENVKI